MHSKRKGNVGQLAAGFHLARLGYSIFTEQGDISKIDLIAERHGRLIRFQCKAVTSKNGVIVVPLRKSGPGYRFTYGEEMFDFFAVFDLVGEELYLLPSKILRENRNTFVLRLDTTRNRQEKRVHLAADYLAERILRDFTGGARPDNAEGEDKVQTATPVRRPGRLGAVG